MKKKKSELKLVSYTRQKYLTHLNYGATGEGITDEINLCWANDRLEAINDHLDRFGYISLEARNHFKQCIAVYDASGVEASKLLKSFFVNNRMFSNIQDGNVEFYFKFYVNLS